jgi:hypothetical protein
MKNRGNILESAHSVGPGVAGISLFAGLALAGFAGQLCISHG